MHKNCESKNHGISIKTIVLSFGGQTLILDVPTILQEMDRIVTGKMNVKIKISAVLISILCGKYRVYRMGDMVLMNADPLVAAAIKNQSHTHFWVQAAKRHGWTLMNVCDFLLALERLHPNVADVNNELDNMLNDLSSKEIHDFFSIIDIFGADCKDVDNNLLCKCKFYSL